MTKAGLERLIQFQHGDGGWGWWEHDASAPYMTAYVLFGLDAAANAGVKIDDEVFGNGVTYLYDAVVRRPSEARGEINRPEERRLCPVRSVVGALAKGRAISKSPHPLL